MPDRIAQMHFRQALKMKRKRLSKGQRKQKITIPRRVYPWSIEKRYARQIKAWLRPLKTAVKGWIKEHGAELLRKDSADHQDAMPGKEFKLFLKSLEGWMGMYLPDEDDMEGPSDLLLGLGGFGDTLKSFADNEWDKATKSILGNEFAGSEAWWTDMRTSWVSSNYNLIQTVAQRYIDTVNIQVEKAVLNGWSYKDLSDVLENTGDGMEGWQADRLARDQIGKMNGMIAQQQSEDAGIEKYTWSTAGDERVRDSHAELDGMICRWDDSTLYSEDGKEWLDRPDDWCQEHPGMDIQCRCTATASIQDIIDSIDSEFEED